MKNQPAEWHGPIRVRTDPPNREEDAAAYLRRGRVLLGSMYGAPRKQERQLDGTVITVMDRFKGEKLIHVALLPQPGEAPVNYGTWMAPTAEDAPNGYVGDTRRTPTTPREIPPVSGDIGAVHSLSYYNTEDGEATGDIRRREGFKSDLKLGIYREVPGTSDNRQGIQWSNAPTIFDVQLDIFGAANTNIPRGGGRQFDLGRVIALATDQPVVFFAVMNGSVYDADSDIFTFTSTPAHWNCLFYKGRLVNLPDAYFQMSFAPVALDYLERPVYNVRIGGAFYQNGKICYVRSLPYYSVKADPTDRLEDEEFVFADATISATRLEVSDQERLSATASTPDSGTDDRLTWSDWEFKDDGSEAISFKYRENGAGFYWRVSVDWDTEAVSGSMLTSPNLFRIAWGMDGSFLRLLLVELPESTPEFPRFEFTLADGSTEEATGIMFYDLRHNAYIFVDLIHEDPPVDKTTLRFWLNYNGTNTVLYDEEMDGDRRPDIFGNFTRPLMFSENAEEGTYTLIAISCQISPGNGWPAKVYNSNQQLLEWAGMSGKPDPALNPILRG